MHSKKIPKDTSTENSELEETYAFNKEQMVLEMGKNIPSATKLKQFLDATRALRTKEVNHNPALDIMALYPALKKPDLV